MIFCIPDLNPWFYVANSVAIGVDECSLILPQFGEHRVKSFCKEPNLTIPPDNPVINSRAHRLKIETCLLSFDPGSSMRWHIRYRINLLKPEAFVYIRSQLITAAIKLGNYLVVSIQQCPCKTQTLSEQFLKSFSFLVDNFRDSFLTENSYYNMGKVGKDDIEKFPIRGVR